jgi:hypothetical protein
MNDRRLRKTFDLDLPWALEPPENNGGSHQQELDNPNDNSDGMP